MASSGSFGYDTTKIVATTANLDIRSLSVGQPRKIVVHNLGNDYRAEWNEAMASESAAVITNAGTLTVATSAGFSLLAGDSTNPPGFRLGALTNINDTTTETLLIEAWG